MKEDDFKAALVSSGTVKEVSPALLNSPVEDLELDSLDLEIIRTTLEKRLGAKIPEKLWQSAPNLRHLMENI